MLQRRNVFRVAIVYLAAAWLLLQVVATVDPILDLAESIQKIVLILLAIGFVLESAELARNNLGRSRVLNLVLNQE